MVQKIVFPWNRLRIDVACTFILKGRVSSFLSLQCHCQLICGTKILTLPAGQGCAKKSAQHWWFNPAWMLVTAMRHLYLSKEVTT
jgi:hypothetical protein